MKSSLDSVTYQIGAMAGEGDSVALKLWDAFSGVFKRHTREDSGKIFAAGTQITTPYESEILTTWPKPWLFSRVLMTLLVASALLYICAEKLGNANAIPGLMFLGALTLPFSVLIFIFETNVPRNISIFEVMRMFFIGGTASLVITLVLFEFFPPGELDYVGAVIVSVVEELGKLLVTAVFVKLLNPRYILNGLLIGAAIGAGFAVFETAGYAFRYFVASLFDMEVLVDLLFLRGWSSLGGHVAWAAIIGAGLVMVKGDTTFVFKSFLNRRFQKFFLLPVALHAIWDCPFMAVFYKAKLAALIVAAWVTILVLLSLGLRQMNRRYSFH